MIRNINILWSGNLNSDIIDINLKSKKSKIFYEKIAKKIV